MSKLELYVKAVYKLLTAMANVAYEMVTCLLLLTPLVSMSVQTKQIIYVSEVNGTLVPSCTEDETELPSSGVEMALVGVELHHSTLVVVNLECKCNKLMYHMIHNVPPGLSLICPQMALADVVMTFMILSDVMIQQKKQLYLTATA